MTKSSVTSSPGAVVPAARIVVPDADRAWILEQIEQSLRSGALTLGPLVEQFEAEFAAYCGRAYAVAVNSGTSALEICLRAYGVAGRTVIVPANTFVATPAAVLHAGGRVRFADVDPSTFAVSVGEVERCLTPDTAGVIAVHVGGIVDPAIVQLRELCERKQLFLLEDAAHAHGSTLGDRKAGALGSAAAFSFYPTKVMTAAEGGMIVTDEAAVRDAAVQFRDQGKASFSTNHHVRLGHNWRMSALHAAVGLAQLRRLDEFIEARRAVAAAYDRGLAGCERARPLVAPDGCRSNYYKYIVSLPPDVDRARVRSTLLDRYAVRLSGEVYETPCHRQPVFAREHGHDRLPHAEHVCAHHICLPVYVGMEPEDTARVIEGLRTLVAQP